MRSESSLHNLYKNEFGSLDSVVFVVRKHVPPTFSFTHCLLPLRVILDVPVDFTTDSPSPLSAMFGLATV